VELRALGKADLSQVAQIQERITRTPITGRCLKCRLPLAIAAPPRPPEQALPLEEGSLERVPQGGRVVVFFDQEMNVLSLRGPAGMRAEGALPLAGGSRPVSSSSRRTPSTPRPSPSASRPFSSSTAPCRRATARPAAEVTWMPFSKES